MAARRCARRDGCGNICWIPLRDTTSRLFRSFLHHTMPFRERQLDYGEFKQSLRLLCKKNLQKLQKETFSDIRAAFSCFASIIIRRGCIQNASKLHPVIECSKQAQRCTRSRYKRPECRCILGKLRTNRRTNRAELYSP